MTVKWHSTTADPVSCLYRHLRDLDEDPGSAIQTLKAIATEPKEQQLNSRLNAEALTSVERIFDLLW